MITDELRLLPARAAQFIRRHRDLGDSAPETGFSVLEVLVHCAPVRGDAFVAFQLLSRRDLPASDILQQDVLDDALAGLDSFAVTEHECEETFGPNWPQVMMHAVDAATVLHERFGELRQPSDAVDSRPRLAAWICARCGLGGRTDQVLVSRPGRRLGTAPHGRGDPAGGRAAVLGTRDRGP
ncbi:hypothetical protein [Rhodococcus jostii]|uniref:hypothetical protein n=1 Tax=Rhodococcus jostii TaxID=132919 RepID=UPI000A3FBE34|nr:hypothetical protein [Rhodococcus jostii]